MRCKLCNKKRSTNFSRLPECWKKWEICSNCVKEINGHRVNRNCPEDKKINNCLHCSKELPLPRSPSRAFCNEGHKAKYYRMIEQRKEAQAKWKKYEQIATKGG